MDLDPKPPHVSFLFHWRITHTPKTTPPHTKFFKILTDITINVLRCLYDFWCHWHVEFIHLTYTFNAELFRKKKISVDQIGGHKLWEYTKFNTRIKTTYGVLSFVTKEVLRVGWRCVETDYPDRNISQLLTHCPLSFFCFLSQSFSLRLILYYSRFLWIQSWLISSINYSFGHNLNSNNYCSFSTTFSFFMIKVSVFSLNLSLPCISDLSFFIQNIGSSLDSWNVRHNNKCINDDSWIVTLSVIQSETLILLFILS